MLISRLINKCNKGNIPSDYLRAPDIYEYMDKVILDANDRLQALFPLMSDWVEYVTDWNELYPETPLDQTNYTAIPDLYLARIIPVGVARYFYMKDEEGEAVASDYFREYEKAMFNFQRDYLILVPDIYQNTEGGYVEGPDYEEYVSGGRYVDGFNY